MRAIADSVGLIPEDHGVAVPVSSARREKKRVLPIESARSDPVCQAKLPYAFVKAVFTAHSDGISIGASSAALLRSSALFLKYSAMSAETTIILTI